MTKLTDSTDWKEELFNKIEVLIHEKFKTDYMFNHDFWYIDIGGQTFGVNNFSNIDKYIDYVRSSQATCIVLNILAHVEPKTKANELNGAIVETAWFAMSNIVRRKIIKVFEESNIELTLKNVLNIIVKTIENMVRRID